jgi:hypothetical protein
MAVLRMFYIANAAHFLLMHTLAMKNIAMASKLGYFTWGWQY